MHSPEGSAHKVSNRVVRHLNLVLPAIAYRVWTQQAHTRVESFVIGGNFKLLQGHTAKTWSSPSRVLRLPS